MSKALRVVMGLASILVLSISLSSVWAQEGDELPTLILVQNPGMMPEGIEWDDDAGHFLLGSMTQKTIFSVNDDGTFAPFIQNDSFNAIVGIHIDHATNRLLVCSSDPSIFFGGEAQGHLAALFAFDLNTGQQLFFADLSELGPGDAHFANDVTVDAEGNAYVTDTGAPVIYKVTPTGEASVFIESELLTAPAFGLNGIEYHPNGYLLAGVAGSASIVKIPLDDPAALVAVELDQPVPSDGLVLREDGILFAVNPGNLVMALSSDDDWMTASVVGQGALEASASTAALREGVVYVVMPHFDNPEAAEYEIVQAEVEMSTPETAPPSEGEDAPAPDATEEAG